MGKVIKHKQSKRKKNKYNPGQIDFRPSMDKCTHCGEVRKKSTGHRCNPQVKKQYQLRIQLDMARKFIHLFGSVQEKVFYNKFLSRHELLIGAKLRMNFEDDKVKDTTREEDGRSQSGRETNARRGTIVKGAKSVLNRLKRMFSTGSDRR